MNPYLFVCLHYFLYSMTQHAFDVYDNSVKWSKSYTQLNGRIECIISHMSDISTREFLLTLEKCETFLSCS